jgi:NADH:ubiquinone oxidoreductase subunit 3 (subunit A)
MGWVGFVDGLIFIVISGGGLAYVWAKGDPLGSPEDK